MENLRTHKEPQLGADMLFADGLPSRSAEQGFESTTVMRAAGITYRQLDYWARTGLISPSMRDATGSGSQRLYSFRDIVEMKLVKSLLDTGVSLQKIRQAVETLRSIGVHDLSNVTLLSDGSSVYMCTDKDEVIDLLSQGHGVFGIALGKVLIDVEATLIDFESVAKKTSTDLALDELAAYRQKKMA